MHLQCTGHCGENNANAITMRIRTLVLILHSNNGLAQDSPDLKLDLLAVNLNRSDLEVDTCMARKQESAE